MSTRYASLLTWEPMIPFLLLVSFTGVLLSPGPSSYASVTAANYFEALDHIHTFGSLSLAGGVFRFHVATSQPGFFG